MSHFLLRRCVPRKPTVGFVELYACRKTTQWQNLRRLTNPSSLCFQRFLNNLHQNCHTIAFVNLKPSDQTQKRFFSESRSANRTMLPQSFKTSKKSASVTADSPAETKESQNIESGQLQTRYVYVQTSGDRWEDVPGGVTFDTAYLDSKPEEKINPAVPLVVSLHSTPGSFNDMQPVLEAFAKSGCRVLAPAFPGTGHTEGVFQGYNDVFTHSTSEKAEFVRDFLVTLDVKKVDLLIGHGSGCYPAMRLTAGKDTSSMFKSTAFLSPWPHRHFRGTSQRNLLPLLHDMWERPYYRPIARALSRLVTNTPNTKAQERITLVYTLYHLDFAEVGGFGITLESRQFPRVMFFAEDDALVDAELSYELADMMGIGADRVHRFAGQLEPGKMDRFPSCLVFEKGGQHIQREQSGVITAVLFNLLRSVRPGFQAI